MRIEWPTTGLSNIVATTLGLVAGGVLVRVGWELGGKLSEVLGL
jgi:hypothetical protein